MRKPTSFARHLVWTVALLAPLAACSNGEVNYPTQPPARPANGVQTSSVVAAFSCDEDDDTLEIACLDQSTGDVESWLWDFGDGRTSKSRHVVHTYRKPGTFILTLTVSNSISSDSASEIIMIGDVEEPPAEGGGG